MSTEKYRRSHGSGSLYVRADRAGHEAWYAHWRSNGRQVKRKIGPKRADGTRDGLTRTQAEAELRRLIGETAPAHRQVGERLDVAELGGRYLAYAERRGRKRSTRIGIESEVRVHLAPFFGDRAVDAISREDVADLVAELERKNLAPKTIRNILGTMAALMNFARRRRWAGPNPCDGVELPAVPDATEIRFLTLDQVDALEANARPGEFHAIDAAMYRTAAMTGLRQGELLALRWLDVDWVAARIRVRRNYVMGQFGTPKSKRSTRSVPMDDAVGGTLERLFKASRWQADHDLVFGRPATGEPLYRQGVLRRFQKATKAAGLDEHHVFHDLRHTFGTRVAAVGVPMRTLQEWMGHRDIATTQRYADYAPGTHEAELVAAAFTRGSNRGSNLSESQVTPQA